MRLRGRSAEQFGHGHAIYPGVRTKLLKSKFPEPQRGPNKKPKKEIAMKHITAIALFIAATFITAGKAIAQDYAVQATIPFNFTVSGSQLPAGNYTLGTDITSPLIVKISDRRQHVHAMVVAMSTEEKRKGNQLVFHKYGNQYFLSEIRSQDSGINVQLATSKQEKRARTETEVAGLPVHDEVMIALY
jgi:hypothetical protein